VRPHRVQFTLRWLAVAVATVALMLACCLWIFRPPVVIVEVARPPASSNSDYDVFDVVLSDLIDNKEFEPATGGRQAEKPQIVFGDTTRVGFGKAGVNRVGGLGDWMREKRIPLEVTNDLMSRNPPGKRYILAGYRPSNPNILVRDLTQVDQDLGFSSQFPRARGYVESCLPGYSRDGSAVLVPFKFGPTPHGAIGCYYLSKVNGRWEIVERLLGYFN
jgi:hypothetical protein